MATTVSYTHFLGIDVSKLTLDYALMNDQGKLLCQGRVENNGESYTQIWQRIHQQDASIKAKQTIVCAEHTGMYTYHLTCWLCQDANLWLESGKQIKHSQGIQRGKNDALDAKRIALYACRHRDAVRLWQPPSEAIGQLKHLCSLRKRLLTAKNALKTPLDEQKKFMSPTQYTLIEALSLPSIENLEKQIQEVDKAIEDIFDNDESLKKQKTALESIPGIGKQTATTLIVKTMGFTQFNTPRQLACHAGIAPFGGNSGTSYHVNPSVSHHADKELKKALHMAALAATRKKDSVFEKYYIRKKAENKKPMSILNAIRNKIVHTACAMMKNNSLFDEKYVHSLA
jgi:transposase